MVDCFHLPQINCRCASPPITKEKPAGHPHAALMALYAQDATTNPQPWKTWQHSYKGRKNWIDCQTSPQWDVETKYRRKLKTIRIGEFDVPEPERVAPEVGSSYWVPVADRENYFVEVSWGNDSKDCFLLSRGLVHLTPEAAETHAKALISLTETPQSLPRLHKPKTA